VTEQSSKELNETERPRAGSNFIERVMKELNQTERIAT